MVIYILIQLRSLSEYRGRGIASKLIEDAFERAKERGFKQVSLNCEFDNEGAMKLYEKLGFKPSYVRKLDMTTNI